MRKILCTGFFINVSVLLMSQLDYSAIDERSKTVSPYLNTCSEIAAYLCDSIDTDLEKVRAIYVWICHNISYDMDFDRSKYRPVDSEVLNYVMKYRRGICQHYATLFHAMCKHVGLKTENIAGSSRHKGEDAIFPHGWNSIDIDGSVYMIDATWSAGYVRNDRFYPKFRDNYFLISPEEFIVEHFPSNSKHQHMKEPLSLDEFLAKDFSKLDRIFNKHENEE